MAVIVYSKPNCPQCDATYKFMNRKGIEYTTIDLAADAAAFEMVQALGYASAPVVIVDGTTHWAGFRPDKIAALAPTPTSTAAATAPVRELVFA